MFGFSVWARYVGFSRTFIFDLHAVTMRLTAQPARENALRLSLLLPLAMVCQLATAETVQVKYHGAVPLDAFSCSEVKEGSDVSRICYDNVSLIAEELQRGKQLVFLDTRGLVESRILIPGLSTSI